MTELETLLGVSEIEYFTDLKEIVGNGWALSLNQNISLVLTIQGQRFSSFSFGLKRPDIAKKFPGYGDVDAGWSIKQKAFLSIVSEEQKTEGTVTLFRDSVQVLERKIDVLIRNGGVTFKKLSEIDRKIVVSIGTVEIRKNYQLLYMVWKKLFFSYGEKCPLLIIVGGVGNAGEGIIDLFLRDPDLRDSIYFAPGVSNKLKNAIIDRSIFTIYPSLYEGWGMPVAESLNRGKVTLASSSSSIPEVGGLFTKYFSPFSVDECYNLVEYYTYNDKERDALEYKLSKDYKSRSWGDFASTVLIDLGLKNE